MLSEAADEPCPVRAIVGNWRRGMQRPYAIDPGRVLSDDCARPCCCRTYRLLSPGSEWRLHSEWFERSALSDLLGADFGLAEIHKLYACHDRLLEHKEALFAHLVDRWRDLFNVSFDVLLYALSDQVKRFVETLVDLSTFVLTLSTNTAASVAVTSAAS
jgi:hypothetical protein